MQKLKKNVLQGLAVLLLLPFLLTLSLGASAETPAYTLTVTVNDNAYGSVEITGGTKNAEGKYLADSEVTLTSKPNTGYRFEKWIFPDESTNKSNPYPLTIGSDVEIKASFKKITYTVDYSGTTMPNGTTEEFDYGETFIFPTPSPKTGYQFTKWKVSSGTTSFEANAGETLSDFEHLSPTIKLEPVWEANDYSVTRNDVTEGGTPLGSVQFDAKYDTSVSGADGENTVYRGYYFDGAQGHYTTLAKVALSGNEVTRTYLAKIFKIVYENVPEGFVAPTSHTFGATTAIPNPAKTGYTFLGWTLESTGTADWNGEKSFTVSAGTPSFTIAGDLYDASDWDDESSKIKLTAVWQANTYSVQYENTDPAHELPEKRTYDVPFTLPNDLTRVGYVFLGWRLYGTGDPFQKDYAYSELSTEENLKFEAGWQNATYTVALNSSNGSESVTGGDTGVQLTYDELLPTVAVPQCVGYRFLGYFVGEEQFYDENGAGVTGKKWLLTQCDTLTAKWEICSYTVSIDAEFLTNVSSIQINGVDYATPISLQYKEEFSVTLTAKSGYKLTVFCTAPVAHCKDYSARLQMGGEDLVLSGTILQTETVPNFSIDFSAECLSVPTGSLPLGKYLLDDGADTLGFEIVEGGIFRFDDGSTRSHLSLSEKFGKTLNIRRKGDGVTSSDSDPQSLVLPSRPEAPAIPADISEITVRENDLAFIVNPASSLSYQFACCILGNEEDPIWQNEPIFTDLLPGTPYVLMMRVAANTSLPHGKAETVSRTTSATNYLARKTGQVQSLRQETDGENVDAILRAAESRMQSQSFGVNFCQKIEDIYNDALSRLPFARIQDSAVSELQSKADGMILSGKFSEEKGIKEIRSCLLRAREEISSAVRSGEVEEKRNTWMQKLAEIPVSYLSYEDSLQLTSFEGVDQKYRLFVSRVENDLADAEEAVGKSVRAGKVNVGEGNLFVSDAVSTLERMDVLAYYRMKLSEDGGSSNHGNGRFEIRMQIPENLKYEEGLRIATFSDDGVLTLEETKQEGNTLIFTCGSVSDFVILKSYDFDVSGVTLFLLILAGLQITVILWTLIREKKKEKTTATKQFAFMPAFLFAGIRALNSMPLVLILLLLVLGLQVVLFWLMLKPKK